MKTRYYFFILLFSISASAQELVINNTVYGQVTSTLYKEARIVRPITPAQFHELCVFYDGFRLNFKNDDDYSACFFAYPKKINWELTEEELRNLRNFIRRNGGELPKTIKRKISNSSIDADNTNQLVSTKEDIELKEEVVDTEEEVVDTEELPLSISAVVHEIDTNISNNTSKDSTIWSSLPNDLDSSRLIEVTNSFEASKSSSVSSSNTLVETGGMVQKVDQMRAYKRKGVIYQNDTLSVKKAKLIAMNQNYTAYRHFAAAQRIRGWNVFWGICYVTGRPSSDYHWTGYSGEGVYSKKENRKSC